jgi:hypothetical protein
MEGKTCTKMQLRKRKDRGRAVRCPNNENASFITMPDVTGGRHMPEAILLSVSQASLLHPIGSVKLELTSIVRSNPKRNNLWIARRMK